jgi:hypothetical protein
MQKEILTPEQVMTYPSGFFIKTATTKIKKLLTQEDIDSESEKVFVDLEGRIHKLSIGRCICIGAEGERWTCSLKSVEQDRTPIGVPDEYGYQDYIYKNPQKLRCFDIPFAFTLILSPSKKSWNCEDPSGGIVTWNGEFGNLLMMRVIQRSIFQKTYTHVKN